MRKIYLVPMCVYVYVQRHVVFLPGLDIKLKLMIFPIYLEQFISYEDPLVFEFLEVSFLKPTKSDSIYMNRINSWYRLWVQDNHVSVSSNITTILYKCTYSYKSSLSWIFKFFRMCNSSLTYSMFCYETFHSYMCKCIFYLFLFISKNKSLKFSFKMKKVSIKF